MENELDGMELETLRMTAAPVNLIDRWKENPW